MEWLLGALGGLTGGNAAAAAKNSLGVGGNSIAGALGGAVGGGVVGAVPIAIVGAVMKGRKTNG